MSKDDKHPSTIYLLEQDRETGLPLRKRFIDPVDDWMTLELITTPKMTKGGVALPDSAIYDQPYCLVRAVGPEVKNYFVGQVIIPSPIGGINITIQETTYKFVRPEHVVAVLSQPQNLSREEVERVVKAINTLGSALGKPADAAGQTAPAPETASAPDAAAAPVDPASQGAGRQLIIPGLDLE